MTEPTRAELLVAATMWAGGCDAPDFLTTVNRILPEMAENAAAPCFADLLARARALLGDEWQPISTAPKVAGRIEVRSVITYRWLPYKPQSEQAKRGIKGRWQFPTSDYGGWTNGELPHNAEWRPLPAPPQGGDRG